MVLFPTAIRLPSGDAATTPIGSENVRSFVPRPSASYRMRRPSESWATMSCPAHTAPTTVADPDGLMVALTWWVAVSITRSG